MPKWSASHHRADGPGLAGLLIQTLGAPVAIVGDAISFVFSALSLAFIRTPEPTRGNATSKRNVWAEFVQSFAGAIYGINRSTISQMITSDRLRGRVAASHNVLGMAAVVVGSIAGGVLGEAIGLPSTMTIGAAGGILAGGWLLFSPLRKLETPWSEDHSRACYDL